jgi:hypothetical protein
MSAVREGCPDPRVDSEGYTLWCELHACTVCDGVGEDDDPPWSCRHCGGSGIEPGECDCDDPTHDEHSAYDDEDERES